jgi:Tol biopolymer transport system component
MNRHFTLNILGLLLLVVITFSSGCGLSTSIDSPTSTPESPQRIGRIIYSTTHGIFSFDLQSKTTNTIFSTDKNQYYSFVVKDSIYFSMGDGISGDIFKINLDGSDLEQLTFDGSNILFSVSPNGNYLAYSPIPNQLFVLNIQTKKSQLVYEKNGFVFILGPWSPDGKKFFFTQRSLTPESSLYPISPAFLYTLEDKNTVELLPAVIDFGFSSIPTWSPDGINIALNMPNKSRSGDVGIYILNIETKAFQEVAADIVADQFEWSPNGNMLVYASRIEPIRLNLFDVKNNEKRIIFEGQTPLYANYQLWSPNSKYIAYFTNISDSPWHLNIQSIDNGELQTFEVPPGIIGAIWIEK